METDEHRRYIEAYEALADTVFRLCYAKTSNREMALDLTQETFMRVWDYLAEGKRIQNMQAFIFTVARNLIKDYYKKKRPVYEHEMKDDLPDTASDISTQEEHAEATRLLSLLEHLTDGHREVLVLRYVEGLGVKEIAEITGERENTISVRINRALSQLRELFDGKYHG